MMDTFPLKGSATKVELIVMIINNDINTWIIKKDNLDY